jgi:hypothetical protein
MRNVAILRDGYSDFLVVRKFIKCVLTEYGDEALQNDNFMDLEQLNITNPLVKFLDKASKTQDYSFHSVEANTLVNELIVIYYSCFSKCQREWENVTNKEIIIINADSERLLVERSNYFNVWAYNIKGLLLFSIEKFYELMVNQGHSLEFLPFIVPLVLFPSSEILIASCMFDITRENLRTFKPTPALKTKVYGTESITEALQTGMLEETLEQYLTKENIKEIYKEIPEARILIHLLTI